MKNKINKHDELNVNDKDEELFIQIENLKEELKDKDIQIEKLIKENKNIKNNKKDNQLIDSNDDEKEINHNKDDNILGRPSLINDKLSDAEKVKIFMKQLKELKLLNESDMIQIKTLKADIKELTEKVKKLETFSGQLKNFNEFVALLNRALMDYTPKKKDQREAFNKLVDVINNHHI